MQRRYALREDQRERIKDLLPGCPGRAGANGRDNRLFVEAVLYRYRAGIPLLKNVACCISSIILITHSQTVLRCGNFNPAYPCCMQKNS